MKQVKMVLLIAAFILSTCGIVRAQDQAKTPKVTKTMQRCQEKFNAMDKDAKGYITLDEFLAGCKHCNKEKRAAAFKAKDVNGDGKLTLDEYCAKKPKSKPAAQTQ